MNYYGGKEMAAAFRTVRKNTIQIAEDIPEDKYSFKATPDTRSIGELLVHIALGTTFGDQVHGANRITDMKTLNFQDFMAKMTAEQAKPRNKAQIIQFLRDEGEKFASLLEGLTDDVFAERVTMMPGSEPPARSRFDMLLGAKEHEMHHRGQLMVLERMVGIKPHLTRQMEERMARMQAQPAAR